MSACPSCDAGCEFSQSPVHFSWLIIQSTFNSHQPWLLVISLGCRKLSACSPAPTQDNCASCEISSSPLPNPLNCASDGLFPHVEENTSGVSRATHWFWNSVVVVLNPRSCVEVVQQSVVMIFHFINVLSSISQLLFLGVLGVVFFYNVCLVANTNVVLLCMFHTLEDWFECITSSQPDVWERMQTYQSINNEVQNPTIQSISLL